MRIINNEIPDVNAESSDIPDLLKDPVNISSKISLNNDMSQIATILAKIACGVYDSVIVPLPISELSKTPVYSNNKTTRFNPSKGVINIIQPRGNDILVAKWSDLNHALRTEYIHFRAELASYLSGYNRVGINNINGFIPFLCSINTKVMELHNYIKTLFNAAHQSISALRIIYIDVTCATNDIISALNQFAVYVDTHYDTVLQNPDINKLITNFMNAKLNTFSDFNDRLQDGINRSDRVVAVSDSLPIWRVYQSRWNPLSNAVQTPMCSVTCKS